FPETDVLDVGARRARGRREMRVEDGELVAVVLEEPELRIDVELEAVRRRGAVAPALVPFGDAAAQDDQATRFVRVLRLRVRDKPPAHGGRDHHHRLRSIDASMSSAVQKSALRYFQPASASTQTTTPSSSSAASLRATWTTAPAETPAKMPSSFSRARTART